MTRLTVVSSFPETGDTYPQVAAVAAALRGAFAVTWVTISERGLFLDGLVEGTLLSGKPRAALGAAWRLARDRRRVRRAMTGADIVLAIDFMAFALAASQSRTPVALWSLDYISDDEARFGRKINRLWLSMIRRGLARHPRVAIQDEARLASFARSMRRPSRELACHLLPVALPAAGGEAAAGWPGKPHVMQIGGIGVARAYSDVLLDRFLATDGGFDLTFHGRVFDDIRPALRRAQGRVTVSAEMVEPGAVPAIVGRCSVGFIGNRFDHEQFRLLKRACGQLVEYLRRGKPVICMGPNDLGPFVETAGVGVAIERPDQFDAALARIHADYAGYSRRALALFEAEYDLALYTPGFCAWLDEIARAGQRAPAAAPAAVGAPLPESVA
jgi:glycosyltransferase involved in cell wall biosynthesis